MLKLKMYITHGNTHTALGNTEKKINEEQEKRIVEALETAPSCTQGKVEHEIHVEISKGDEAPRFSKTIKGCSLGELGSIKTNLVALL
jgi:hypothetical protein